MQCFHFLTLLQYILHMLINSDLLSHLEPSRKIVYYMYIHLLFTCLQMNEKKKFNTFFAMSSILLCLKVARFLFYIV